MTTPTTPLADDPLFQLLRQVVEDVLAEQLRPLHEKLSELDQRLSIGLREVKAELGRQDGQIQNLDRRVAGNYTGLSERLDMVDDDLKRSAAFLINVERAIATVHRDQKILHGRFIELQDILGARLLSAEGRADVAEADIIAIDRRVGLAEVAVRALEGRVAGEPSVASLGGGG